MTPWYRSRVLQLGLGLLVLVNALLLSAAAYNRGAGADSNLALSDRELMSPFGYFSALENSGMSLRLNWRIEPPPSAAHPGSVTYFGGGGAWLTAAKLTELGIKVQERALSPKSGMAYNRSIPIDVLLVLEINGPAYQHAVQQACNATGNPPIDTARCNQETNHGSRLFVVDAGLDREALRKKFPDRKQYAVVRGQIGAALTEDLGKRSLQGYVSGLANDEIDVPLNLRAVFGGSKSAAGRALGRDGRPFSAVVKFGRRLEPWLASLSLLPDNRTALEP